MESEEPAQQIAATWRRHNDVMLYLLDQIPREGLRAVPAESRGRDVAAQLFHLIRVREGWAHYHATGRRPKLDRYDKERPPTKAQLKRGLRESGRVVEAFLLRAVQEDAKPRLFGKQIVRWFGYLLSHESHHRGQIMLALKQSGLRLPERVAVDGLWGKWIYGK
jgi:uncharacterized damage-inducible protein DinB